MTNVLSTSSYNCKNIKSSIDNVMQLCDVNDIVFLQETWLTHDELYVMKSPSLHPDFFADGVSAMDTSCGMIKVRPFGGIGILWRKSIGSCIHTHKYNDSRVMAIEFNDDNRRGDARWPSSLVWTCPET